MGFIITVLIQNSMKTQTAKNLCYKTHNNTHDIVGNNFSNFTPLKYYVTLKRMKRKQGIIQVMQD